MFILKEPESQNGEAMSLNIKRNAPDADINPALKIACGELMLPTANYRRLQESRSPSPLPEPRSRIPSEPPASEKKAAPPPPLPDIDTPPFQTSFDEKSK